MTDFANIAEKASVGALWLVLESPTDKAFTAALWERLTYRPSKAAFDNAVANELLYNVDPITYRFTELGLGMKAYLRNQVGSVKELEYA
jgi:hypothetical protein